MSVTLAQATTIVDAALKKARELNQMAQTIVVLDAGGHVVCAKREDGSGIIRFEVAVGKAYGALAVGKGSRWLHKQAAERPHFLEGLSGVSNGKIVPVPGGVLVKSKSGELLGAVGISGDTSDNDEACAVHAIEGAGLVAAAE